jgi:hypothetical protein
MEKCFQRTLYEYEDFINAVGTPTIVCRRTGEVAAVGKEFSILTGWKKDVLLGKEPNLNVNTGGTSGPGSNTASLRAPRYPELKNREGDGIPRAQPVFLAELLDDDSVMEFYEDFAKLAFGDSRGSINTRCRLLRYTTKRDPEYDNSNNKNGNSNGSSSSSNDHTAVKTEGGAPDSTISNNSSGNSNNNNNNNSSSSSINNINNNNSKASQNEDSTAASNPSLMSPTQRNRRSGHQQQQAPLKHGIIRTSVKSGETGFNGLGAKDGKVECSYCWTVKRDVFDIPMLIVMNVSTTAPNIPPLPLPLPLPRKEKKKSPFLKQGWF